MHNRILALFLLLAWVFSAMPTMMLAFSCSWFLYKDPHPTTIMMFDTIRTFWVCTGCTLLGIIVACIAATNLAFIRRKNVQK